MYHRHFYLFLARLIARLCNYRLCHRCPNDVRIFTVSGNVLKVENNYPNDWACIFFDVHNYDCFHIKGNVYFNFTTICTTEGCQENNVLLGLHIIYACNNYRDIDKFQKYLVYI